MNATITENNTMRKNMPRTGLTVTGVTFPLRLRITPRAIEEFKGSEEGSWEDHGGRADSRCRDIDSPHAYVILERYRTFIEIRDANEALCVYLAACSGTWQTTHGSGDGRGFYTTACHVCDELRKFVPAQWLLYWPRPAGV
jgi:hypothetical protein